jgi:taurine dioxygenase
MTLRITPISGPLGVEITGISLDQTLSDGDFSRIREAFEDRSVMVVRDQRIGPDAHIAFSRRFGTLEHHVLSQFHLPGHPEILVVSNEVRDGRPIGLADAGSYWHSDLSYMAEPSLGSLLHAQVLPSEGGDTLFVSMIAAYEALPDDLKQRLDGTTAVHDYAARMNAQADKGLRARLTEAQAKAVPPVVHPVVRVHPATGRKALFVNEGFSTRILELDEAESRRILDFLFAHMVQDRFLYRHKWRPHDIVMWDNRAAIHLAAGCPPHLARTLYRTTIRGDRPRGPARTTQKADQAVH